MSNVQKVIKYLAVFLAGFIVFAIINFGFELVNLFLPDSNSSLKDFHQEYQNITEIEIDSSTSKIIIQKGEIFSVVANNVSRGFEVNERDGVLEINEKSKKLFNNTDGIITITVNGNLLNDLDIDHGAGKLTINDIDVNYFNLEQGAGKVEINNVNFLNTNIDGGAGAIFIKSSTLKNLDLDMGVGKVEINANIEGKSTISCGVGELILDLLGNKDDYQFIVNKGVGSVSIDGIKKNDDTTYGVGPNTINLDGGVGNISVVFQEQ